MIKDQAGMKQGPEPIEDPQHKRREGKPKALTQDEIGNLDSVTLSQNNDSLKSKSTDSLDNIPVPASMFDSLLDIPTDNINV